VRDINSQSCGSHRCVLHCTDACEPRRNPFNFGDLALDDAFTDREVELRELKADIRNGQNVVVFAPRRYGKSSLVWRARRS
jgi:Predicted ATPase (AAA+ superfamily)